jgi:hypothetical protein
MSEEEKDSESEESTDALFEALWSKATEDWDNDKPHQALLQHALDKQMLPELAGRYRKLQDDPEKGARAKKKIDGIIVAATQMMMATKTPLPTKTPWSWTLSAVLLFGIVIAFLFYKLILGR